MREEDVRHELWSYRQAKRRYTSARISLEECETMIMGLNIDYSAEKVQTTPDPDKLAEVVDRLSYLRKRCIDQADEAVKCMEKVKGMIDLLDGQLNELLTRYYVKEQTWEVIAVEMGRSWTGVHKMHRRALKKIAEKC